MKDVIPVSKAVAMCNKGCCRNYARLIKEMNREIKNSAREGRDEAIVPTDGCSDSVMRRVEVFYVSRGYGFRASTNELFTVTW